MRSIVGEGLKVLFKKKGKLWVLAFLMGAPIFSYGQRTQISGIISDAKSGEPLPFVNVLFQNSSTGISSDLDGNYSLTVDAPPSDSLVISYMGYLTQKRFIKKGTSQVINISLSPDIKNLDEVVVVAGKDPAYAILKKVIKNKKANNPDGLKAYECESYSKIEVAVNQLSDKLKKKKAVAKIIKAVNEVDGVNEGRDQSALPVFFSESLSRVYFKNNPKQKTEHILKSKLTGVGIQGGNMLTQMVGSSFQDYNFYHNRIGLLGKDLVSPIASGGKMIYDYILMDSLYLDDELCYEITLTPKRKQDLAFEGTMWISAENYALRKVDLKVGENANLNFIKTIEVYQELQSTSIHPSLPLKTRLRLEASELTKNSPGMVANFEVFNRDFKIDQPKEAKFYSNPLLLSEDVSESDDQFWEERRHEPLTKQDQHMYAMIDTIRSLPVVRAYEIIGDILFSGYKKVGKIDVGTYLGLYSYNNIEGNRFRLAFRTNDEFSRRWTFKGYMAYGTKDDKLKYGANADYVINRYPWISVGAYHKNDLSQLSLENSEVVEEQNPLFYTFNFLGNLNAPLYKQETGLNFQAQLAKGLISTIGIKHTENTPLYDFSYLSPVGDAPYDTLSDFTTSEVTVALRYAKGEKYVMNNQNKRSAYGQVRWPIFTLMYTAGLKDILGSDFDYHKISLNIQQNLSLGVLGKGTYSLTAGKIFGQLPYPLLKNHLGNDSPFLADGAFNTMNPMEFASDQYVSFKYSHRFEGFILNRVPLIRRLNWRLVGSVNALYGSLSDRNANMALTSSTGFNPQGLGKMPYLEVGYGVENIFKVLRVDFFHRLNYLESPDANRFAVKLSLQFRL
ncbi:DUF5686 and carboxypeptidase-like regulatory domain-containing protein [Xanthovirga aplysinae]|uniref:DUF5686 and carboxypeptidase-like regulatory domain-containing protein n=1 Tax=Xanthovirga aplysinae TaxID=2529853 RepID=UPI0012BBBB21|nr:DUF5686 and carboxypeptidase-like regulatory domain-containing protein [Xanthovirga aplysinae]MTI32778.1 carboxypeptidase-like regulatory domain-containing protein [Xanthovirga aplysinae]